MYDDFPTVAGMRKRDQVLVYGSSVFMDLKRFVGSVDVARKGSDLTRLLREGKSYDRIVVTRDVEVSDVGMQKIASMNHGLVCFFVNDARDEESMVSYVAASWPWHDVWSFDTNVGRMVVTDAKGKPELL